MKRGPLFFWLGFLFVCLAANNELTLVKVEEKGHSIAISPQKASDGNN